MNVIQFYQSYSTNKNNNGKKEAVDSNSDTNVFQFYHSKTTLYPSPTSDVLSLLKKSSASHNTHPNKTATAADVRSTLSASEIDGNNMKKLLSLLHHANNKNSSEKQGPLLKKYGLSKPDDINGVDTNRGINIDKEIPHEILGIYVGRFANASAISTAPVKWRSENNFASMWRRRQNFGAILFDIVCWNLFTLGAGFGRAVNEFVRAPSSSQKR